VKKASAAFAGLTICWHCLNIAPNFLAPSSGRRQAEADQITSVCTLSHQMTLRVWAIEFGVDQREKSVCCFCRAYNLLALFKYCAEFFGVL
jgi:hypothetical protein